MPEAKDDLKREKVRIVPISNIEDFPDHPFQVKDDESMDQLVESIRMNGVLNPVIALKIDENHYQLISGHRRKRACMLLGIDRIPLIGREMTKEDAIIEMVDSNLQRECILPSEKARAYKMKMDAVRRQAGRPKNNLSHNETNYRADEVLSEQVGDSRAQIRRYIRLTELIPELLEYLDLKRIQFTSAVEISYLDKEIQKWLFEYIRDNGLVKPKQIALLREACKTGIMTEGKLIAILNDSQPGRTPSTKNLISEKKLRKYFPTDYTEEDMRSVIVELLEQWSQGKESE